MTNTGTHPADGFASLIVTRSSSIRVGIHSQVRVRYMSWVINRDTEGEGQIDGHYEVEGQAPVVCNSHCEQLDQWNRKDHEERCLNVDSENEHWNSYHKQG